MNDTPTPPSPPGEPPQQTIRGQLGINTIAATIVIATIALFGFIGTYLVPGSLPAKLFDHVFGISDYVTQRVRSDLFSELGGQVDAAYTKVFLLTPDEVAPAAGTGVIRRRPLANADRSEEKHLLTFFSRSGQRVCLARSSAARAVQGSFYLKIDGNPWPNDGGSPLRPRPIEELASFDVAFDITDLVDFRGGTRGNGFHEVELVTDVYREPGATLAQLKVRLDVIVLKSEPGLMVASGQRECPL